MNDLEKKVNELQLANKVLKDKLKRIEVLVKKVIASNPAMMKD